MANTTVTMSFSDAEEAGYVEVVHHNTSFDDGTTFDGFVATNAGLVVWRKDLEESDSTEPSPPVAPEEPSGPQPPPPLEEEVLDL